MTSGRQRVLAWDGCINVRDLGGLPLEDGGETRFGVVVRADSIRALSEAGWRALGDYGVRLAVDLRGDAECADDPPGELPIDVVRFPMDGREIPVIWEWPTMREAYLGLLAGFQREFAGAVAAIARADATAVVHCHGGRDRTGLVSGLILRLAGVPLEAIAADHASATRAGRRTTSSGTRRRWTRPSASGAGGSRARPGRRWPRCSRRWTSGATCARVGRPSTTLTRLW